jgi:hypothetical protein
MPNLSDLLGRLRQSQMGVALGKIGSAMSAMLPGGATAGLTPDQLTPPDAQLPSPTNENLARLIAERSGPPPGLHRFMGTPLASLLKIPRGRVMVPGSQDFTALTGKESPAQPLADWMGEVNEDLLTPGNAAQALVPFGLKPFGSPEAAIKSSVESNYYARRAGKGIESRLIRTEKRGTDVGAPKNPRTVLTAGDKTITVGNNTPEDRAAIISANHASAADIWNSALWYDKMGAAIGDHFDVDALAPYKIAYAVTQASSSPKTGIESVLRAERLAGEMPEPKQPAANPEALQDLFAGKPPKSGIGQKISEMIDTFFSKQTRTQMMDQPKYGAPVTGDRHDFRAKGYIDPAYESFLRDTFGPEQTGKLKLDTPDDPRYSGRVNESQFENLVRKGNEDAAYFNQIKLAGHDDWNTGRAQAALWTGIKRFQGDAPQSIPDMFASFYSQVPMELAWGENSPYANFYPDLHSLPFEKNQAITSEVLPKVAKLIGDHVGVRVIKQEPVTGAYEQYQNQNPNVEFTIFGTPKARQDWVDAMAHAANQTAVLAYHPLPAGKGTMGAYDLSAASPIADTQLGNRVFQSKFLQALQAKNPIFNNAEILNVAGHPTIRLVNVNPKMEPLGQWKPEQLAAMESAAQATAAEQGEGFNTQSRVFGADHTVSYNDWNEAPNGQAHLSRFSDEGRSNIISRLEGPFREQTSRWIEEAFHKHAPDEWNSHFGIAAAKPSGAGAAAGAGAGSSAASAVKGPYKPDQLGFPSSPEALSQGWVMPNGSTIQIQGTHPISLAAAAGLPMNVVIDQFPALAAKGGMIRVLSRTGRSGMRLIADIFTDPTDAQIRALSQWDKANVNNHIYDGFHFALTNPETKQTVFQGTGVNNIRRAIKDTNFDIPF